MSPSRPPHPSPSPPTSAAVVLAGLGYAALSAVASRTPPGWELGLLTRLNGTGEHRWLRGPQQLGTPWALPVAAAVLATTGRPRRGAGALLALPAVKGVEVATKKVTGRPRPVHVVPTVLRDDAPVDRQSFPSGHTAIATSAWVLAGPVLPTPLRAAYAAGVVVAGVGRVHQGAHHPSDVVGGALLGVVVAGAVGALVEGRARVSRGRWSRAGALSAPARGRGRGACAPRRSRRG